MRRATTLATAVLLGAAWAGPARAALEDYRLPESALRGGAAAGARPPERGAPGRVLARADAAFAICTDGVVRDARRARLLKRRDKDHRSSTSLTAGGAALDPDAVRYFVLPRGFQGASLGDLALVTYGGRSAWAIAGDTGPCEGCLVGRKKHRHPYAFGEGSVALARALGVPGADDGKRGGAASGATYLIFPGTARDGGFASQAELERYVERRGAELYARLFAPARQDPAAGR